MMRVLRSSLLVSLLVVDVKDPSLNEAMESRRKGTRKAVARGKLFRWKDTSKADGTVDGERMESRWKGRWKADGKPIEQPM